ncbi:PREDICTED: uncharacterized protein LOC105556189, partial [Vollenhovia emeryi]|uniref:uncharacterized protein LOC105556189 n=1 Tax=Vollenhovia emeryi TaxID=411798 RepID=UPI0005F4AFB4
MIFLRLRLCRLSGKHAEIVTQVWTDMALGRAAEVIQSLESSAENYTIAWNLLTKRFEDKRAIASRHLQLLLDIPVMQKESGTQLRQTLDSILRHIRALEFLKVNTWDSVINYLMIAKLDASTRREWRTHIKDKDDITVASLTDFLEERCLIVEPEISKAGTDKTQSNKNTSQQKRSDKSASFANTTKENRDSQECSFCNEESHSMYSCNKFKELPVQQRTEGATNTGKTDVKDLGSGNAEKRDSSVNCTSVDIPGQSRVLLSTARVWIYDSSGKMHECRLLLDSASQSNFLSKALCERLQLATQKYSCSVGGLASSINVTESASTVIQSKRTAYHTKINFLIIERIIDKLPLSDIDVAHLRIPDNIRLADDRFHMSDKIDGILGASIFWSLLCIGQVRLGRFQPTLQKTHLGWIVSGSVTDQGQPNTSVCCFSSEVQLRDGIEGFWKIEEVDKAPVASKDDEDCETHFRETHQQDDTGRFTVSFPFKGHTDELGESYDGALKRFYKLEQRFNRDPRLKEEYVRFMEEYITLNHMTIVNEGQDESSIAHYIPHHPVVTTYNDQRRLRVVFDASAKTSSGKSLNDILLVGPTIQQTLFSIILRFRQHQHVLTADVIKMYRQVNITERQRNLQRILWRSSSDGPVQAYTLNTVTYGISAAPFMAIRALQQTAHNAHVSHPDAAR